jgi:hypothetical protein
VIARGVDADVMFVETGRMLIVLIGLALPLAMCLVASSCARGLQID